MPIKVTRKTNNLDKLRKKILEIKTASVESGYFSELGDHPEAGMSYASLMNLHEYGFTTSRGVSVPERSVRREALGYLSTNKSKRKKAIYKYLYQGKDLEDLLESIGRETTEAAQSIFGSGMLRANSPIYMTIANKGANTPLIFDGYLQHNWSWRTSEAPSIKNLF